MISLVGAMCRPKPLNDRAVQTSEKSSVEIVLQFCGERIVLTGVRGNIVPNRIGQRGNVLSGQSHV
jgi:hypothetical protein